MSLVFLALGLGLVAEELPAPPETTELRAVLSLPTG